MLRSIFMSCMGVIFLVSSASAPIASASTVLTFEGLGNLESINGFYNGGSGGNGSIGTNYGVEFSSNALALIDSDAGGSGNIGGEPSPSTVLFFLSGSPFMNVAAGFDTGFSFFYSAINNTGSLKIFDGLNGTGNELASLFLPLTPSDGGDPTGSFSPFVATGVAFNGIAKSVVFGGVQNQIAFDNVTFGSSTPVAAVPEPASMTILGLGALSFCGRIAFRRRRLK